MSHQPGSPDFDGAEAYNEHLAAEERQQRENDLHYLRSILGNLREVRKYMKRHGHPSLAGELLSDNIDWLDCYIDKLEREGKR
jgi:hypothetical protein